MLDKKLAYLIFSVVFIFGFSSCANISGGADPNEPTIISQTTGPIEFCMGVDADLETSVVVEGGLAPYTYTWKARIGSEEATIEEFITAYPDVVLYSSDSTLSLTIPDLGEFPDSELFVIVTDSAGQEVQSEMIPVTVSDCSSNEISAIITAVLLIHGINPTFTAVPSEAGDYTYEWSYYLLSDPSNITQLEGSEAMILVPIILNYFLHNNELVIAVVVRDSNGTEVVQGTRIIEFDAAPLSVGTPNYVSDYIDDDERVSLELYSGEHLRLMIPDTLVGGGLAPFTCTLRVDSIKLYEGPCDSAYLSSSEIAEHNGETVTYFLTDSLGQSATIISEKTISYSEEEQPITINTNGDTLSGTVGISISTYPVIRGGSMIPEVPMGYSCKWEIDMDGAGEESEYILAQEDNSCVFTIPAEYVTLDLNSANLKLTVTDGLATSVEHGMTFDIRAVSPK